MPINVQMPDGTIISDVPDNASQADVLAKYQSFLQNKPPAPITPSPTIAAFKTQHANELQGQQAGLFDLASDIGTAIKETPRQLAQQSLLIIKEIILKQFLIKQLLRIGLFKMLNKKQQNMRIHQKEKIHM